MDPYRAYRWIHRGSLGDRYLRGLFVAGALAVIRYAKIHGTKHRPWLTTLSGKTSNLDRLAAQGIGRAIG